MATATIQHDPNMSRSMSDEKNLSGPVPSIMHMNADDLRPQKLDDIFFYNIAPQDFTVSMPPNHPRMLFKRCPRSKPYVMVGRLTHPYEEYREDQNFNRVSTWTNGYREAMKVLCPLNPGTDQDWDDPNTLHQGGNLCRFGVFWSTHNPPLEEELEAARNRLEASYRAEIESLVAIEAEGGPDAARARANRLSHAAAEYFNQSFSWHRSDLSQKKDAGKVDCTACGEKIMAKAKLCIHCGAPTDPEKQDAWLKAQFERRGPGRPPKEV